MTVQAQPVHLTSPDALKGLADVVVPDPVSWSPQTWGWWVLAAVLLVGALLLGIRRARRFLADRYRREALEACAVLETSLDSESRRPAAVAEMAVLLKRTALSAWPRGEVASLSGAAWIDFLRRHGGRARVDEPIARLLDAAEYEPGSLASVSPGDAHACARAIRNWIECHRVSA
jgi:hypothetical protein